MSKSVWILYYRVLLLRFLSGGGILDLDIYHKLLVEGTIQANGVNGYSTSIGGGSGGFIKISARDLEGSGSIKVTGGAGGSTTGAGGGGRMAIYYSTTEFWFGDLDARGGSATSGGIGGAGTVYLKVWSSSPKHLNRSRWTYV